jgi:hypothetical protein
MAPAIVRVQPSAAAATRGEALEQGRAISHRAAWRMRVRVEVGAEARLIGFIGHPVDEAFVVAGNEDRPFGAGQMTHALLDRAIGVDVALAPGFSIRVGASINRIREDVVDGRIGWRDPADLRDPVRLEGKEQPFGAKPEPDLTGRAEFGEALEDGADGGGDGSVGMETNFAFLLAPDETDRQAATQGPAGCFIANAAIEPRAQDMEFGLAHGAL